MSTSVPSLHVSSKSKVEGSATILIQSRVDAGSSGVFQIKIAVTFDPATNDYPSGTLLIKTDLSDSAKASFKASSIEFVNSFGKHNPTIALTGRCSVALNGTGTPPKGCRYWVLIADNKTDQPDGTPDIVGFVIHDRAGNRVAYGTGPVKSGDLIVAPM